MTGSFRERSARRIERSDALPSQSPPRSWRTRQDPLATVWGAEVVPLLQAGGQLNAVTLLEELQRRHPGEYGAGVLRTLHRRMRQWRAVHGIEREVFFAQEHPPGRLSDFTVADDLGVEIEGTAFDHRLYQFALAHSGWRHAVVVIGGESPWRCPRGCRPRCGAWEACRRSTAPIACLRRSTTWPRRRS